MGRIVAPRAMVRNTRMDPRRRIVTSLPLAELWDDEGELDFERGSALNREDVRRRVQGGTARFVVAEPGLPLRWVSAADRHAFWKGEVRPHLVDEPERPFDIYHYPHGYAYIATEWRGADPFEPPIVLLERHH
jgi:hypothetical protein